MLLMLEDKRAYIVKGFDLASGGSAYNKILTSKAPGEEAAISLNLLQATSDLCQMRQPPPMLYRLSTAVNYLSHLP